MALIVSRIILTILFLSIFTYMLFVVWTKNVDLIAWGKDKIKNKLPVNNERQLVSYSEKDKIIANKYFYALSEFLVKFRLNLHMLISPIDIDPKIEQALHPGSDLFQKAPDLDKVDDNLILAIFTKYDFTKPAINFTPSPGQTHPTNIDMLIGELSSLNKKCDDILIKYASNGDPKLIQDIEIMKNRTDNLIGSFGLKYGSLNDKNNLDSLVEFFSLFRKSLKLSTEIKNIKF